MTSSNGNIFCVTGPLYREFISHQWIPLTKLVTRSFHVFFDLHLNKRLGKQSWGWWFEMPSRSLWRHCNVESMLICVGKVRWFMGRELRPSDTYICVSGLTIIGSDDGLSPGRHQAIIWTNAGILLIGPLRTNFSEISIKIHTILFKKKHLKMSAAKWRPFCLFLNVLTHDQDAHMRQWTGPSVNGVSDVWVDSYDLKCSVSIKIQNFPSIKRVCKGVCKLMAFFLAQLC